MEAGFVLPKAVCPWEFHQMKQGTAKKDSCSIAGIFYISARSDGKTSGTSIRIRYMVLWDYTFSF